MVLCHVGIVLSYAQTRSAVSGRFIDSETQLGMVGVVIEIAPKNNPEHKRYVTTESGGYYSIAGLKDGYYDCVATFLGKEPVKFSFYYNGLPKTIGAKEMESASIRIETVVTTAVVARTEMVGDTLRYNVDAFKVAADAEVEALLKKMPGIVIRGGRIEAQGEEVKKVYIDGREFFGGNMQQAIQSIPAQAVESIEIFNLLSEASRITGVDDGEGGKVINIITKSGMNRSQFGKLTAGLGYEPQNNPRITPKIKYNAGGSVNIFRDDTRLTVMALANNVNKQNFSDEGMQVTNSRNSTNASNTFSVNSQNGVARAELFAVNYIDRWGKRRRAKFEGNLFFNHLNAKNEYTIDRWYEAPAKKDTAHYDQYSSPDNYNLKFRGRLDWKVAKRQKLVIIPNINYNNNSSVNSVDTTSTRWGETYFDKKTQTYGTRWIPSGNQGWNKSFSGSLYAQYSYNFLKTGRSMLLVASISHSDSDEDRDYYSYSSKNPITPEDFEKYSFARKLTSSDITTVRIQPTWRERIGRFSTLNITYRYNNQFRHRDVRHYTTGPDYEIDESKFRPLTSSNFKGNIPSHQAGVGYRFSKNRNWFSVNAMVQITELSTHNLDTGERISNTYIHPSYNATLQWNFSPRNALRLSAASEVKSPGLWNMLNIYDVTNTTYITRGNPYLKPYCEYNFFARYTNISTTKGTTFMLMAKVEHRQDYLGQKIAYSPAEIDLDQKKYTSAVQLSKPVNLDGFWTYEARTSIGFPVKPIRSNLNLTLGTVYSTIPTEVVNGDDVHISLDNDYEFNTPGEKFILNNITYNGGVILGSNISENVDFTLDWNGAYSSYRGKIETMNNEYFTHSLKGNVKCVLPLGFTITSSVNFTQYIGFTNKYRDNFVLWNMAVGKKIMNKLGEVEFVVHDILNQNTSFGRYVVTGYSQVRYNSTLGRYFMVRFTYNLRSLLGGNKRIRGVNLDGAPVNHLAGVERRLNELLKF